MLLTSSTRIAEDVALRIWYFLVLRLASHLAMVLLAFQLCASILRDLRGAARIALIAVLGNMLFVDRMIAVLHVVECTIYIPYRLSPNMEQ